MSEPRILLFDIESSPNIGYSWGKYDQTIYRFIREWDILCVGYQWWPDGEVAVLAPTPVQYRRSADRLVVKQLFSLFNEADVVVAHNATKFDVPKARTRFSYYGLGEPAPYRVVDTLTECRRQWALNSNKLDDVSRYFGFGAKGADGGFDTWLGCMAGRPAAWQLMIDYCKQDVHLLADLYKLLLPGMVRHPNLAALIAQDGRPDACPRCAQVGTMSRQGWRTVSGTRRPRFQCKACGAWCQGRPTERTGNLYVP